MFFLIFVRNNGIRYLMEQTERWKNLIKVMITRKNKSARRVRKRLIQDADEFIYISFPGFIFLLI